MFLLGYVLKQMYVWVICCECYGELEKVMQIEVVDIFLIDSNEVLVFVMVVGVNYNGIWVGLGVLISFFDGYNEFYYIVGLDVLGIVWVVGDKVCNWKVGDQVVIYCNQDDGNDEECNGGDLMFLFMQCIWGYEMLDGSFVQFICVQVQ